MRKQVDYVKYIDIPEIERGMNILDSNEVCIFEKIDGSNCQVRKVNYEVRCGSRSKFIDTKGFERDWFLIFRKWAKSNKSLYNLPEHLILYGEWVGSPETAPTQTLIYNSEYWNKFFMIDLYDLATKKFINYDRTKEIAKKLKLKDIIILRTLYSGKPTEEILIKNLEEPSDFMNGQREGIVAKDYDNQIFIKLVLENFREIRTGDKLIAAEKYVTPSRIKKVQQDLIADGKNFLEITLDDIVEGVIKDVSKEQDKEIRKKEAKEQLLYLVKKNLIHVRH